MERKKVLIITAGGSGTRMGAEIPKQFLTISGKAILQLTIEKFLRAVPDIKIITVLPQSHLETWRRMCYENNFICPQTLVAGGITRFHSVRNALAKVDDDAIVAVHDAVRPFVSEDLIRRLFALASESVGVVPVTPCIDTLKVLRPLSAVRSDAEPRYYETISGATADRSVLFAAQTPQIFHSEVLKAAYTQAYDTAYTDDASVVETYLSSLTDKPVPSEATSTASVLYVGGERLNIKITTPDDLRLAAFLSE